MKPELNVEESKTSDQLLRVLDYLYKERNNVNQVIDSFTNQAGWSSPMPRIA